MDEKELRKALEIHLDTLRRNLEVVSLEVLKTKYQKPYEELRGQICKAATEYTRHVALCDIRIRRSLFDEAKTYIDAAIQQTQCLKKISEAAFQRQDNQTGVGVPETGRQLGGRGLAAAGGSHQGRNLALLCHKGHAF